MINCFLFGFYYLDIKILIEKQLNQTRVCNNTEYDVDYIGFQAYKDLNKETFFSNIWTWECSSYKNTYRLDNKMIETVLFMSWGVLHKYRDTVEEPNDFKYEKIWKHTITISNLIKDERHIISWWMIVIEPIIYSK